MKTRIAAIAAVLVLGFAPISSAMAFENTARNTVAAPYDVETTGAIAVPRAPSLLGCPMRSAAEGNANQQNFPVMQYGQTSGGNRC